MPVDGSLSVMVRGSDLARRMIKCTSMQGNAMGVVYEMAWTQSGAIA